MSVRVRMAQIRRRLQVEHADAVDLTLTVTTPAPDDALPAVLSSLEEAERRSIERLPADPTVCGSAYLIDDQIHFRISDGPLDDAEVAAVIADLVQLWNDAAISGTLVPQPRPRLVNLDSYLGDLVPTLFLVVPFNPTTGRGIDPDVAAFLAPVLAPWVALPGSHLQVDINGTMFVAPADALQDHLLRGFTDFGEPDVTVESVLTSQRRLRVVRAIGAPTIQHYDLNLMATEMSSVLVDLLRRIAPALTYACVRSATAVSPSFRDLERLAPPRRDGREVASVETGYEFDRKITDVCATQLLTDDHLAADLDLTEFEVETVAPGRHLVAARDQTPWWRPDGPDNNVRDDARAALEPLLTTWPEIASSITAHRRAYSL